MTDFFIGFSFNHLLDLKHNAIHPEISIQNWRTWRMKGILYSSSQESLPSSRSIPGFTRGRLLLSSDSKRVIQRTSQCFLFPSFSRQSLEGFFVYSGQESWPVNPFGSHSRVNSDNPLQGMDPNFLLQPDVRTKNPNWLILRKHFEQNVRHRSVTNIESS